MERVGNTAGCVYLTLFLEWRLGAIARGGDTTSKIIKSHRKQTGFIYYVTYIYPKKMKLTKKEKNAKIGRKKHSVSARGNRILCTVVAHHLFLPGFPPRPSRDLLFPTSVVHMYIPAVACLHWCQMAEFRAAGPKNGPVKFLAA